MNTVTLLGRIGQEPELKKAGDYDLIQFSMATSRRYKKGAETVEDTQWHQVKFWGKTAEIIAKYFKKGSRILVTGRIETRSWDDNGSKRYATEIIGETFEFIDKSDGTGTKSTWPVDNSGSDDGEDLPF